MNIVTQVITNIIVALYQYLGISIVIAFLYMFFHHSIKTYGLINSVKKWIAEFRESWEFRSYFTLVIYVSLILCRTVFCREIWWNPVSNVLGSLNLYYSDGSLNTETIENVILFIPFTFLMLLVLRRKVKGKYIWCSLKYSFELSIGIELTQIIFRVGTFQLSDLCFNTLGGVLGGIAFWSWNRGRGKKKWEIE